MKHGKKSLQFDFHFLGLMASRLCGINGSERLQEMAITLTSNFYTNHIQSCPGFKVSNLNPVLNQAMIIHVLVWSFRFGSATPKSFKVPLEDLQKEAKIIDPNDYQAVLAETKELFNSENPFLNVLEPSSLVPAFPESQPAELNAFDRNFMMGSINEGMQLQRELEALLQDVNVFN